MRGRILRNLSYFMAIEDSSRMTDYPYITIEFSDFLQERLLENLGCRRMFTPSDRQQCHPPLPILPSFPNLVFRRVPEVTGPVHQDQILQ